MGRNDEHNRQHKRAALGCQNHGLGSLALIHTHYRYSVDLYKVVDIFAKNMQEEWN